METPAQTIRQQTDYWLSRVAGIVCTKDLPIFTWAFDALEDEAQGVEYFQKAEETHAALPKERLTTYRSAVYYWESAIIRWTQAILLALKADDHESLNHAIQARRRLSLCLLQLLKNRLSFIEQESLCPPQPVEPPAQSDADLDVGSRPDTLLKCQPVLLTSWVLYARTQPLEVRTMHVIKTVLEAYQHEQEGSDALILSHHAGEQALAIPLKQQAAHWHSALRRADQAVHSYQEALKCWHEVISELTTGELSLEITYANGHFEQLKPTTHPYLAEAIARRNALYSQIHELFNEQAAAYRRCQPIQEL